MTEKKPEQHWCSGTTPSQRKKQRRGGFHSHPSGKDLVATPDQERGKAAGSLSLCTSPNSSSHQPCFSQRKFNAQPGASPISTASEGKGSTRASCSSSPGAAALHAEKVGGESSGREGEAPGSPVTGRPGGASLAWAETHPKALPRKTHQA